MSINVTESLLTPTEAAKVVGVSRSLLYLRVKEGKLTRRPDGNFDVQELLRCFGEFDPKPDKPQSVAATDPAGQGMTELQDWLTDQIDDAKATIERKDRRIVELERERAELQDTHREELREVRALLPSPEQQRADADRLAEWQDTMRRQIESIAQDRADADQAAVERLEAERKQAAEQIEALREQVTELSQPRGLWAKLFG